jgi:hypothetical protein
VGQMAHQSMVLKNALENLEIKSLSNLIRIVFCISARQNVP